MKRLLKRIGGKCFPRLLQMVSLVGEDYHCNGRDWTFPGFRAVAVHRFGAWVLGLRPRLVRAPFSLVRLALYRYVRNHYGIELQRTTQVGRRFIIAHQGGIVIHWLACIGDDCLVRQGVTIGAANGETVLRAPVLGNRVEVGAGAVIMGGVTIGDDVRIGPNVVVTTNIPAGSTVVAPPPRVLQLKKRPLPEANAAKTTGHHV